MLTNLTQLTQFEYNMSTAKSGFASYSIVVKTDRTWLSTSVQRHGRRDFNI